LKKPPASAMKDYEKEVLKKIHARSVPAWGVGITFSLAVLFLFLVAFVFWVRLRPVTRPAPMTDAMTSETETALAPEESPEKQLAQDLLILEILGEDEGILDAFERMEGEVESLMPASTLL